MNVISEYIMAKFSVLMSVYYRELPEFLDIALASVFDQTVLPDEVVLVKDGPLTPGLDAVISRYAALQPELHVITLPENVGLGSALNEGLKHCSYDLVARMDSDDICKPNRFEKQLAVYAQSPHLAVVGSWVDEFIDDPAHLLSVRRTPCTPKEICHFARKRNPLNHPTVMFRKDAIQQVGGYQPFFLFEDYYLWVRLLINGFELYNIQESLLFFRSNPQMIARRGGLKYALSEWRFLRVMHKVKWINTYTLLTNGFIRFTIRIMPNKIRTLIYKKLLR
ncbi:glycosyltransferase [uncultured Rikenella sp.]|uniref:glycosyltransferase n=1 Tax=uncultured Rikenella sp. TaxID=368003 RepID=UPI0025F0B71F|nr:glycosyltransferase [uncultured Rikenella sp.]